ncbi:sensor histidine kinase [Aestuariirhabdus sp. Z084]|uniref:sensor histidine kinase n=1 Tax=Aestuariirhabdus haliotis TaxID=2918751 RepID=UPI00201B375C|nr:sensor histidine kinase [Aestuariirhabdus haliotis]MCL6416129.1 sensor histidine kinase [Aestuariirhabdus haliotis]MCL6420114.1 sensor histidine kinase [Aestuariirhabdus haliotis]
MNREPVTGRDAAEQDFFLPDLCRTRAVLALILITELLVLVEVLADSGPRGLDWDYLAISSLFVQWIMLSSTALLCLLRNWLSRRPLPQVVFVCLLLVSGVTLSFSLVSRWMVLPLPWNAFWFNLELWPLIRNLVIGIIITGMVLRYLYVQHELHRQQKAELRARLQSLQSRIRPHFLFNSMNSIASLIAVDPDKAEQAVVDLSELFRASLQQGNSEVTIRRELDLCRQYLRIEKLRLGKRLQVDWHMDGVPGDLPIPLLTLQPLLENAIHHGIQPLTQGGTVTVSGEYRGGLLSLRVSNPMPAGGGGASGGNRIALANTEDRLQALYGSSAKMIRVKEHQLYMVVLSYPCSPIKKEAT